MPRSLNVVALIAAYNEEDIIGQAVRALIDEGVQVYFLDHHSTDRTLAEVKRFKGKGVIGIETFPVDPADNEATRTFAWEQILARKEELARTLKADWFIHHDADEFRESPWSGLKLADAIARVDAAGYSAIDFHVLNFWPTTPDPERGGDIRERLQFYEPGRAFDRLQVKCWKKTDQPVVLTATGGHSAQFAGRRIFPVRFLLRHYPIRSQEHGHRKVFQDRVPRFSAAERARGWHVQYDDVGPGASFVRDPATLVRYDPDAVRMELWLRHRDLERLERVAAANQNEADRLTDDQAPLRLHLQKQDAELEQLRPELERLRSEVEELGRAAAAYRDVADRRTEEDDALRRHLERQDEELAALRPERGRFIADLEAARGHAQAQSAELARLRQELAGLHDRARLLDVRLAQAAADREAVEAERTALQAERDFLARRLLSEQAAVARLRPERDALAAGLEELRRYLPVQDVEIDRARRHADRLASDLDAARTQLAARETTVAYLLASRSWRLTAPLRAIDRLIYGRSAESTGRGLALANFPVGRGLRLASDVLGLWGDGWAGRELRFRVLASRPITAVRLVGVVPSELPEGQDFRVSAGDHAWTHHAGPGRFEWLVPIAIDPRGVADIEMTAARSWRPDAAGASADSRELAWHVERVEGR